jgi:acyl-coenzyme A thioesterase PaaI-like protein
MTGGATPSRRVVSLFGFKQHVSSNDNSLLKRPTAFANGTGLTYPPSCDFPSVPKPCRNEMVLDNCIPLQSIVGNRLAGLIYFGPDTEGAPGKAHGGSIASIADSMMGILILRSGISCVTITLTVNYKKFIPLQAEVLAHSIIKDILNDKKIVVEFEISSLDKSIIHCSGSGVFIRPNPSAMLSSTSLIPSTL